MLSQISASAADHMGNPMAAMPMIILIVVLLGIGAIAHYRETH